MNRKTSAQFTASDLSDHEAKTWKRISLVLALIGVIVGSIAGIAVVAGNIGALALLVPVGIPFLAFAAAIWVMLRTRNRQLRLNPKSCCVWALGVLRMLVRSGPNGSSREIRSPSS